MVVWIVIFGFILYNVVDDQTRTKFDNGWESQQIKIAEIKNDIYLFFEELGGTDEKVLAVEKQQMADNIEKRKSALAEKEKATENNRLPASEEPTSTGIYSE